MNKRPDMKTPSSLREKTEFHWFPALCSTTGSSSLLKTSCTLWQLSGFKKIYIFQLIEFFKLIFFVLIIIYLEQHSS